MHEGKGWRHVHFVGDDLDTRPVLLARAAFIASPRFPSVACLDKV